MLAALDVVLLSTCAVLGNVGVAITGFGHAIIFLFVYQIMALCGYDGVDIKFAVFVQMLALLAGQPLLLHKASLRKHATRPFMLLFLPVTVLSTPLGQYTANHVEVDTLKAIGGVIVMLVGAFEIYKNRALIANLIGRKSVDKSTATSESAVIQVDEAMPTTLALPSLPSAKERSPAHLSKVYDPRSPVFFMIGSQRSGSNWLRTMLNEREDLAGPHPPHILRDFAPIVDKFGDMSEPKRVEVLIDHVCTFVERNQVPWTNKHVTPIVFDRVAAKQHVMDKLGVLDTELIASKRAVYTLIGIMDFIYSFYAEVNDKRTWMCKSMGMSKFHNELLVYFGVDRLRYIYLVRDPRDVAMSFMKTPVGDCHYYAIVTKWCRLQDQVLPILRDTPDLILLVRYESLLVNKEKVVEEICEFIGKRRFGKTMRLGSVLAAASSPQLVRGATVGTEATKAAALSYQFKNLTRGDSFSRKQLKKWMNGDEPLSPDEIVLIESIAHTTMRRLDYELHSVTVSVEPTVFTELMIAEFDALNNKGIAEMLLTLEVENPEDAARRKYQEEILQLAPTLISEPQSSASAMRRRQRASRASKEARNIYKSDWPLKGTDIGYLDEAELRARISETPTVETILPNGYTLKYAAVTQRNYTPTKPNKPNQDATTVKLIEVPSQEGRGSTLWFGIYDGHGPTGDECAQFSAMTVPRLFEEKLAAGSTDAQEALHEAHVETNRLLALNDTIDDSVSGTTATSLVLHSDGRYVVANIGDASCLIGSCLAGGGDGLSTRSLASDHSLYNARELARIKSYGARVGTSDQLDGSAPMDENWQRGDGEVPRVWAANGDHPGCAFTRSIGDSQAEALGVVAKAEMGDYTLCTDDQVIFLSSDGITDFIDHSKCLEISLLYTDPQEACRALIAESYERWITSEDRTDDLSVIVIYVTPPAKDLSAPITSPPPSPPPEKPAENSNGDAAGKPAPAVVKPKGTKLSEWSLKDKTFAVSMGFLSGFLGGLCGIRGPPIMIFFLHPPFQFGKAVQRSNGTAITFVNVVMRAIYYAVEAGMSNEHSFQADHWPLYLCVALTSVVGILFGNKIFERIKNSQATIKTILSFFLVLCGTSLLITAFVPISGAAADATNTTAA